MFNFSSKGDWRKTRSFLTGLSRGDMYKSLSRYGQMGVDALEAETPVESGLTAGSWAYRINKGRTKTTIEWYNTNREGSVNIAIILQYGHATGTGGYVQGRDYINPAMRPVFDKIADGVFSEIRRL